MPEQFEFEAEGAVLVESEKGSPHAADPQLVLEASDFVLFFFPASQDSPQGVLQRQLDCLGQSLAVRLKALFDRAVAVEVQSVKLGVLGFGHDMVADEI